MPEAPVFVEVQCLTCSLYVYGIVSIVKDSEKQQPNKRSLKNDFKRETRAPRKLQCVVLVEYRMCVRYCYSNKTDLWSSVAWIHYLLFLMLD